MDLVRDQRSHNTSVCSRFRLRADDTIGLVYLIVGLAYVQDPDSALRSPIAERVEPFALIWTVQYIVGATLLLCGNRGHQHLRRAGLWVLLAAWAENYVASLFVLGPDLKAVIYIVLGVWAASAIYLERNTVPS